VLLDGVDAVGEEPDRLLVERVHIHFSVPLR
jgi:hypothetical protein